MNIYDMNVGGAVSQIEDAHTRSIHTIRLNSGSNYVKHPAEAYNLFFTAAVNDGVHLWDIRTNKSVRHFSGHVSRAVACGIDYSPCGRYLASGSEDRSAYIYDIRTGGVLNKLTGHTDAVTDVSFHPQRPEIVTACADGKLRVFASVAE
eukprot:m.290612 g.290612  ORF g.290612 m.290612 type:complete len:149 (-) comp212857_c0_seq1:104-550(-)